MHNHAGMSLLECQRSQIQLINRTMTANIHQRYKVSRQVSPIDKVSDTFRYQLVLGSTKLPHTRKEFINERERFSPGPAVTHQPVYRGKSNEGSALLLRFLEVCIYLWRQRIDLWASNVISDDQQFMSQLYMKCLLVIISHKFSANENSLVLSMSAPDQSGRTIGHGVIEDGKVMKLFDRR